MKRLPNELLTEIYSYLSIEDVVNLPFHITSRVLLNREFNFRHSYTTLEVKPLGQLVRLSTNPSLSHLVTKLTICTRRTGLVNTKDFLNKAWKEHVRRRNKSLILATQPHERSLAPGSRKTSKPPENLNFETFHELIGVAESECYYCHALPLKSQYSCAEAKYYEWEDWHMRRQDISMLKFALCQLRSLRKVCIDHKVDTETQRVNRSKVADALLGTPQFFFHPRYNECPMRWSIELYKTLVQTLWPPEEAGGIHQNREYGGPCVYDDDALHLMITDKLYVIAPHILFGALFPHGDLEMTTTHNARGLLVYRGTISAFSDICIRIEMPFRTLLGFTRNMHFLHGLTLGTSDDMPGVISDKMGHVLESDITTRLSILDLSGYSILQYTMAACLKAAAHTLRNLRLHRMALSYGSWASLFDGLGGRFHLETLSLRLWDFGHNLVDFDEKDILDVLDWLCGKSDFHPLRMMNAEWYVN